MDFVLVMMLMAQAVVDMVIAGTLIHTFYLIQLDNCNTMLPAVHLNSTVA